MGVAVSGQVLKPVYLNGSRCKWVCLKEKIRKWLNMRVFLNNNNKSVECWRVLKPIHRNGSDCKWVSLKTE